MSIFMLRSKPHNIERIDHFLTKNEVAIGWSETGDLTGFNKEDIRNVLSDLGYQGQSLSTNLGLVNSFINEMKNGDVVLIREKEIVHVGFIGDYKWKKEYEDKFMTHTRPVEWKVDIPFNELSASMQSLLKNIRTICKSKESLEESGLVQHLSKDYLEEEKVSMKLDNDEILNEAIDVLRTLMKGSEDETIRLEATKELLRHLK
ncbi:hypothetical protein [Exiguobacterium sp. s168]|uniref:hypothetical protein n=1 Tax=Exiguobacterium sp. s168 TaxID=2751194 RepID=UPI001BE55EFC|nr:hypothetical protein [Exiguobacterium sp. s168]